MNRFFALSAVATMATCLWLGATPSQGGGDKESADQKFMRAADEISLTEIRLGKMAQENAANDVVKKFGERTMKDHSRMNGELADIAAKKGITLSKKLDQKHQGLVDQLAKLKGMDFDKTYTKDMVMGHKGAIKHFEAEIKNGSDADVKAWAEKWLPTLREHLQLAQAAAKDVKGEK